MGGAGVYIRLDWCMKNIRTIFETFLGLIVVAIEAYKLLNFYLADYGFTHFAIRHHRRRAVTVFGRIE